MESNKGTTISRFFLDYKIMIIKIVLWFMNRQGNEFRHTLQFIG